MNDLLQEWTIFMFLFLTAILLNTFIYKLFFHQYSFTFIIGFQLAYI